MYSLGAFSQLQVPEVVDRRISWEFPGTQIFVFWDSFSMVSEFQNLCRTIRRTIQSRELDSLLVIKDGMLENPPFIFLFPIKTVKTSMYQNWEFPDSHVWWHRRVSGCWFQTCFIVHFIYGMSSFPLTFIFFKMVKNHQPDIVTILICWWWSSIIFFARRKTSHYLAMI